MSANWSDGRITFSSGKTIDPAFGVVGIGPDLALSDGYDGRIDVAGEGAAYDPAMELTPAEVVELADLMIGRWQAIRELMARKTYAPLTHPAADVG